MRWLRIVLVRRAARLLRYAVGVAADRARPLVFGVILWLVISSVSLLVIYSNQISIS